MESPLIEKKEEVTPRPNYSEKEEKYLSAQAGQGMSPEDARTLAQLPEVLTQDQVGELEIIARSNNISHSKLRLLACRFVF